MPESIIVYRNPLEAALWEGLMSGSFFPLIVGAVVFFVAFIGIHSIFERFGIGGRGFNVGKIQTYIALLIATLISGGIIYMMWI